MRKCTPREIIKEVSDVQTVILPDYWLDELSDTQSVFISFYDWMQNNGRIPLEDKESLHNRTYVGENLFKKLRAAEKNRLQRKLKIKGEELERAVNWSDLNSGPMTAIEDCKISGDVILVIPASSQQSLDEFSSKIYQKEQKTAINIIKASAGGATFYYWLLPQIERPDRIGDIARDIVDDTMFPRESEQYEEIRSYLKNQGACSAAIESLKEAWLEYLQQYPNRVQPFAWCGECGKRVDIDGAFLALSGETSGVYVLDADCLNKYQKLNEIVSYPLSGVSYIELEELIEKNDETKIYADELLEDLVLWGVMPVALEGLVYFVQSEKTYAIKIGFTSGPVEKRISSLQTTHPYKLHLLAAIPGNREYEKSLHERFSLFRLNGEWFQAHPDLLDFIAVILKGLGKDNPL